MRTPDPQFHGYIETTIISLYKAKHLENKRTRFCGALLTVLCIRSPSSHPRADFNMYYEIWSRIYISCLSLISSKTSPERHVSSASCVVSDAVKFQGYNAHSTCLSVFHLHCEALSCKEKNQRLPSTNNASRHYSRLYDLGGQSQGVWWMESEEPMVRLCRLGRSGRTWD